MSAEFALPGGAVFKRCGCLDPTGRRRGASCPFLSRPGHGSWYWTVDLGRGPDGRRRRRRRGGYPTSAAAKLGLKGMLGGDGTSSFGPGDLSTGQWLRRWLVQREGLRPSTRRMYASHLTCYLLPALGSVPVAELSDRHIRRMTGQMVAEHDKVGRPLQPATVVRVLATLRSALNAAIRAGLLAANPMRLVELPPRGRPHAQVWTDARVAAWRAGAARPPVAVWTAAQTARFLAAAESDPLYPLLLLVALRGLRRGEAAGLTWSNLDLELGTLSVTQQVVEVGGSLQLGPPKSAASRRTLALDTDSLAVLRRHFTYSGRPPGGYVVASSQGGPIRPKRLSNAVRRLAAAAGLPPVRLHDLRHGAASLALAAGADLKVVQDLLGHASIVLTADTYITVLPEVGRAAAEGVAALIRQAGTEAPARYGPLPTAPASGHPVVRPTSDPHQDPHRN